TGFTQATLKDLHQRLQKLHRKTSPFSTAVGGRGRYSRSSGAVHWVSPKLVAEVDYAGWTEDGLLRQAAFRGLRDDKPASAVTGEEMLTLEQLQADSEHAGDGRKRKAKKAPSSASATKANRAGRVVIGGVSVSHPDRKVYTKPDFSKKALVEYYASVAEFMLPHLLNRRVALLRCPQG